MAATSLVRARASALVAVLAAGAGGVTACAARVSAQRTSPLPPPAVAPDTEVYAAVGRDWLEVRFPGIALANTGCPDATAHADGTVQRWYQWRVTADFPDRRYPNNHFMGVYVAFALPDAVTLTEARLDSALAAARITVDEARGEPPMMAGSVAPARARARREGTRVRLRVEGAAAVRAFLRARADSVDVGWCQRDEPLSWVRVPLRRAHG